MFGTESWRTQDGRGLKAVAERSHFGDLDVPKCFTSTATLRAVVMIQVDVQGSDVEVMMGVMALC